jgi:hypothetical protein
MHHVDRDSKAHARIDVGGPNESGINADQVPPQINERAAGVARINGGVRLNEVFIASNAEIIPMQAADDARRYALRLASLRRAVVSPARAGMNRLYGS